MTDIIREIGYNEICPKDLKADSGIEAVTVGGAHSSARSSDKVLEISLHYSPSNPEDLGRSGLV